MTATAASQKVLPPVQIDVWSSLECPWCYIGKRRLEEAVSKFDGQVEIVYHSFFAAPPLPEGFEGNPIEYVSQYRGYAREDAERSFAAVIDVAKSVGLDYHYDQIRQTDTEKAEELIHHAHLHGRQDAMVERLLREYFIDGGHLGDLEFLADIAAELGLERSDTLAALRSGRHAEAVEADRNLATQHGIRGIPFYVVDGRFGLSGAQESSIFLDALQRTERRG